MKQRKHKSELPDRVHVFVCDYSDDKPILAAVSNLNDVPEGQDGCEIGCYERDGLGTFRIVRSVDPKN